MKKEYYFENEYAEYWIEDEVFHLVYKPNLVTTLNVAKKIVEDRLRISNGVTCPGFLDARNFVSIDRASMKYYKTKEIVQYVSAMELWVYHPMARFAGNVFLSIDVPLVPTKLFTDKEKTLKWLE